MSIKEKYMEILEFLYNNKNVYTRHQIKELLSITENKEFDKIIKTLLKLKVLIKDKHKRLSLNRRHDYLIGTYVVTKTKKYVSGYTLNGNNVQLNVSDINSNDALFKDKVLAIFLNNNECKIIHILEHENIKLVGTYLEYENYGFVFLDNKLFNKDIHISLENKNMAKSYDRVEVEILPQIFGKNPEGVITKILDIKFDDKEEKDFLDELLSRNHIEKKHSLKAINQIKKMLNYEKKNLEYELSYRTDLTYETIFTIDDITSKDLDDAISIKILNNGNYLLGVHIADVSHYVCEDTKIDEEAFQRGTSIYLIDKVIPMLPPILSNDICSLNPNQIRLTLSCEMEINKNGEVVNSRVFESFIKSKAKLTYTQVTAFFEGDNSLKKEYPLIADSLLIMKDLMFILNKKRLLRGSIEFESEECKIELDNNGNVLSVNKFERGIANDLIEEFMLVCNETIAETYCKKQIPFIYRVHDLPREDRYYQLENFIKKYNLSFDTDYENIKPKNIQDLLTNLEDSKEYLPISLMALRSMTQARYKEVQSIHFGLAANYYTHFTSPIRRYPDLMIHRIIKEDLHNNLYEFRKRELEDIVKYVSKECSKKERIADNIEKEYDNLKKAEYLLDNTEELQGIITNFTNEYIEVTLDNTIVGKVRYSKKEFILDENTFVLKSDKCKYELGQSVTVKVKNINIDLIEIYFSII